MPTVTVAGAHGQTVTLNFDTNANAALAGQLAAAITAGVEAGSIVPAVDTDGPPPVLSTPGTTTGEFVQTQDGTTTLPAGYKAFVNTAHLPVVFGSGDDGESVLSSSTGNLNFVATGGSGAVVAGGGNNFILIPPTDKGDWSVNTGNGDDTVVAGGDGNDTIKPGFGNNAVSLGGGNTWMQSNGDDTVSASGGQATISAIGDTRDLIFGGAKLIYLGTDGGSATIFGGLGSDTFHGGQGSDEVHGGASGNNLLFAGTGNATLFGGGIGDQLYAAGDKGQALHAGVGNETLSGVFSQGADTFYGGSGAATIIGGKGNDTFVFSTINGGGSSDLIRGFASGRDTVDLQGYSNAELKNALKHQENVGGSSTIKLSDNTTITFAGVSHLTASDFITTGGGSDQGNNGSNGGSGNNGGNGNGHSNSGDDLSHMKDTLFKPHT